MTIFASVELHLLWCAKALDEFEGIYTNEHVANIGLLKNIRDAKDGASRT